MGFPKKSDKSDTSATSAAFEAPKRGAVDSKKFAAPLSNVRTLQGQLADIAASLEASAKETAGIEEERRQEGEKYAFDLKLARDKQLAEFARQDAEREAAFAGRESALTIAEGDFAELLGVEVTPGDHLATGKALRTALETKLGAEFERGKKDGATAAKASYEIAKQIDAANAKTELALLTQKNAQLEKENNELKTANAKLLEAQATTNATVADVAKKGLEAAAGVRDGANAALSSAAGVGFPSGSRGPTR